MLLLDFKRRKFSKLNDAHWFMVIAGKMKWKYK